MTVSYPRLAARTLRFTLGLPRNITVSGDGSKVYFLRTPDGETRTGCLWSYDVATQTEQLIADPEKLLGTGGEQVSAAEKSRRERTRESAAGIVSYALDRDGRWATFALSGHVWSVHLGALAVHALPSVGGVIDPRVDATGRRIAYASDGALRIIGVAGDDERALVEPSSETEVWGQAEFIAAEEMDRFRGFWWAPDGQSLLVECSDDSPLETWHIADPENPEREPATQRYPAAGTANATVSLWHINLAGERTEIDWDHERFEYLGRVSWNEHGAPLIQVLSRDQRSSQVLSADIATGRTTPIRELSDDSWIELSAAPRFGPGGVLITVEDIAEARQVVFDGEPVGDASWNVRAVVDVDDEGVLVSASQDPTQIQLVKFGFDRTVTALTDGAAIHTAAATAGTIVISRSTLDTVRPAVTVQQGTVQHGTVQRGTVQRGGSTGELKTLSADPGFTPEVQIRTGGEDNIQLAVLFPRDHRPGSAKLPVLMDPYGGPHAQRVLASGRMFLESQWMADQGFCVVVADGRGTPGRGPSWERAVRHELATVTLADQVVALETVAAAWPDDVDSERVAITGWSYGGYLAALAVLERPDVFHAAVAGAPVTEWRLYDTCYTERYLGDPNAQPEVYDRNSLLPRAANLDRPLMLIHGLADDNVVAAHTLRLSSALLAAGKAHTVLPLSGVTHMASQEVVAENLKLLQIGFLKDALS